MLPELEDGRPGASGSVPPHHIAQIIEYPQAARKTALDCQVEAAPYLQQKFRTPRQKGASGEQAEAASNQRRQRRSMRGCIGFMMQCMNEELLILR